MRGKWCDAALGALLGVMVVVAGFAEPALATVRQSGQGYGLSIPSADMDAESQRWLRIFYEGNLVTKGWKEITADIMGRLPVEQREGQGEALRELGRKISLEWCKPNKVRRINTTMLMTWGNLLEETAKTAPDRLPVVIVSINQEVDSLLD